ncbi:MAG: transporter substrate-binding protein [Comamonadaceae bacterium]|nr:transporter substrate-binding protein [Comamonadaceae bacterium]
MWAQAVEKAKSTDTDKVIAAMAGQTFKAPSRHHGQDGREEPPPAQARCSSARSRPTASSTWCGRRQGPVKRRSRGARSSPSNEGKKDEPAKASKRRRRRRRTRAGGVPAAARHRRRLRRG